MDYSSSQKIHGSMENGHNPYIYGCFQKIVVHQNGWFVMENPIKMHGLGVPLFLETPIYSYMSFLSA